MVYVRSFTIMRGQQQFVQAMAQKEMLNRAHIFLQCDSVRGELFRTNIFLYS